MYICFGCLSSKLWLQGVSHRHLSDHLSDLIENTLGDLEQSKVSGLRHSNAKQGGFAISIPAITKETADASISCVLLAALC